MEQIGHSTEILLNFRYAVLTDYFVTGAASYATRIDISFLYLIKPTLLCFCMVHYLPCSEVEMCYADFA